MAGFPVKKVVLFKHGVAHVEREGFVADDQAVDLLFRQSEMNDVLKSLTVGIVLTVLDIFLIRGSDRFLIWMGVSSQASPTRLLHPQTVCWKTLR
jgi:hypothetical protein